MLNISELLMQSMKRQFPNKDAMLIVLRELKTKETLLAKTEEKSLEAQYKWLKKMKSDREASKQVYTENKRFELAKKEENELTAINQLLTLVEAEMPKQLSETDIKNILINGKSKGWTIREAMQYFKQEHPLADKSIIAKLAKEIL
jgi:uncharacterized protein YqeY